MAAPLNINAAADLVDLSIQNVFDKTSEPEVLYPKFFNVRQTEDYIEKDSSLSGLGEADFVDENAVIHNDVPVQGNTQTYTQNMIAINVPFTHRMWKFGIKKRDLDNVAMELRASQARKREKLCAERLENGSETTSYTHVGANGSRVITISGGDGKGPFDNNHTREDGGTDMNNIVYDGTTYNMNFDYDALKAAHRTASLFVDPRGNPRSANLDVLLVKKGSAAAFRAQEILGAIRKGNLPGSADRDGSGVAAFQVIENDYLATAAQWYMFDSSRAMTDREGFQFVESEGVSVDPVNIVYKTKEIQTSSTSMFDLGHNDVARSWVGSLGTDAGVQS